jgi:hypothetical protein
VDDRHDPVDAGIGVERARALDLGCREAGDGSRAVHGGEDADVVPRARPARGSAKALEGGALGFRQEVVVARVLGEAVVAREIVEPYIVLVHPFAGRDVGRGEADDLAELLDRLAVPDGRDRHLVALHDALPGRDGVREIALLHGVDRDDDVVPLAQMDDPRRAIIHYRSPRASFARPSKNASYARVWTARSAPCRDIRSRHASLNPGPS